MPGKPVSRRTLAATSLAALSAGLAAGHAGVPGALVDRLKRAFGAGSRAPLAPPDATAAEYRRQRLAMFRASPMREAEVVMLGDSHTEGGPWSELLAPRQVLNRGIGWDTAQDVLDRLDEVIARRPKLVFVLIGIVDLRYGAAPNEVAERIETIATRLREAGSRPVVQSVLPVSARLREDTNEKVRTLNERLRTLPDFLDLHPTLVKDGALDPALTYDGVHLSGPAYLSWGRLLQPAVARLES